MYNKTYIKLGIIIREVQTNTSSICSTRQGTSNKSRKSKAYHYSTQAVFCVVAAWWGDVGREIQITERVADGGVEFPSVLVLPGKPEMKFWMILNDPQLHCLTDFPGRRENQQLTTQHLEEKSLFFKKENFYCSKRQKMHYIHMRCPTRKAKFLLRDLQSKPEVISLYHSLCILNILDWTAVPVSALLWCQTPFLLPL